MIIYTKNETPGDKPHTLCYQHVLGGANKSAIDYLLEEQDLSRASIVLRVIHFVAVLTIIWHERYERPASYRVTKTGI